MDILLDTHILLWHITDNPRLSVEQSKVIENTENRKFFSIASLWEMAIKSSIGKLELENPVENIVPEDVLVLDINMQHVKKVQELPLYHRDPFDRMIIAQAMMENLKIMTDDEAFKRYDVEIL